MKILSITAGAAGMYCGSCFRDNAIAAELIRQGHDVTLLPVYTPTRTDEENVSDGRQVLFGGINVYLQQKMPIFRRMPRLFDRLIDAPGVLRRVSSRAAETSPSLLGDLTVSMLEGESGVLRKEFRKLTDWMAREPLPDVINLPNSLLIAMAAPLRAVTGRPIACTLQGEELFLNGLRAPYRERALRLIRAQVPTVDHFIAVSEFCARNMSAFLEIPTSQISVVPLGIRFDGYGEIDTSAGPKATLPGRDGTIGYFARIAPEKGLHALAAAFVKLSARMGTNAPRLAAAGYLGGADVGYLERIKQDLSAAGCADRFTYHGELDRNGKIAFLRGLDVLSVPATYDEPKGMFLLEAMASGVPVVQPRRGAFVEIVERTGGGLLVDADNVDSLADGLERVLTDVPLAHSLGRAAFDGVRTFHSIDKSAVRLLEVYEGLVASARGAAYAEPSQSAGSIRPASQ
jgi:glycosyltransferase involved in cell wall biosynthesis